MTLGTVIWYDAHRGVGAITVDGTGNEVLVHAAEIDGGGMQSLRVRDRVAFEVLDGPHGPRAAQVWIP